MRHLLGAGVATAIALAGAAAHVDAVPEPARFGLGPASAPGVAFRPLPGRALPLGQSFTAADGRSVRLGAYFDHVRPVVLVPGYHRCTELCGLTLQGVLEALAASGLDADAYRVLRVSIDPDETADDARARIAIDAGYASTLAGARTTPVPGWPPTIAALVGSHTAVDALTAALGYEAGRLSDDTGGEAAYAGDGAGEAARAGRGAGVAPGRSPAAWAHAAGFVVATPDGRIARAFDGVRFDPVALRNALVEGADGRLGTLGERLLLVCSHLDPLRGGHAGTVLALVRGSALGGLALLGFLIWRLRRPPSRTGP